MKSWGVLEKDQRIPLLRYYLNFGVKDEVDYCCTWTGFDLGEECKYKRRLR